MSKRLQFDSFYVTVSSKTLSFKNDSEIFFFGQGGRQLQVHNKIQKNRSFVHKSWKSLST